jgi:hypothetical protein
MKRLMNFGNKSKSLEYKLNACSKIKFSPQNPSQLQKFFPKNLYHFKTNPEIFSFANVVFEFVAAEHIPLQNAHGILPCHN